MCSVNKVFTDTELTQININPVNSPLSPRSILVIASIMAISLCAMNTARASEVQSNSVKFAYSASGKTSIIKRKVINNGNTAAAVKASYFGRAPYVCTPSGFGRTSTCFAR